MKRIGNMALASVIVMGSIVPMAYAGQSTRTKSASNGGSSATNPPITLTTVVETTPDVTLKNGMSYNNNPWTKEYLSKYGITVKALWAVDSSQWSQKTDLMMTTGQIPDFFLATPVQFQQLNNAGLIQDLTQVYQKDAPTDVKEVLNEGGPNALKSATINGKLMAIPYTIPAEEGAPVLWVRTDWLKKLHLQPPKTMRDVLKIADAFTHDDPNGDGKNDTYGLGVDDGSAGQFSLLEGFFNGYHAYDSIWMKDGSGKLVYSSIQPQMKTALGALKKLYKDGDIDPTFGNQDVNTVDQAIAGGKIGMFFSSGYAGLVPLQSSHSNDHSQWQAYPVPSIDSHPAKLQATLGAAGYWVVSKNCPYPEAILKLLNLWVQNFYKNTSDKTFHTYISGANSNALWELSVVKADEAFANVAQRQAILDVMAGKKKLSALTPGQRDGYNSIKKYEHGDQTLWWNEVIYGKNGSMGVVANYSKNNQFEQNEFITAPTPTMTKDSATLQTMEVQDFTNIIKGGSLNQFDQFVSSWEKLGGSQMTTEVNQWYKSTK